MTIITPRDIMISVPFLLFFSYVGISSSLVLGRNELSVVKKVFSHIPVPPLFATSLSPDVNVPRKQIGKYDFIIVGGGTAGCVLANRLSAAENRKVLVLEAGSEKFETPFIKIPAGILKLFKTEYDWDYETEPNHNVAGRKIYLCRGKVLGGSSCANVLLYHRGNADDYDSWAESSGDEKWSSQSVLPYFKKHENNFRLKSDFHGTGGEFAVSEVRYQNPLSKAFLDAGYETGYDRNDDFSDWSRSQEGVGRYQVSELNGERCSTASAFLKPVLERENLEVLTSAFVNRLTFTKSTDRAPAAASGVDFEVNGELCHASLAETGEVILAGGSINSPQILMLSGIGPRRHLEKHEIDVIHDLPGVGKNLQDHPAAVVSYSCAPEKKGISVTSQIRIPGTTLTNPLILLQWILQRKGPLTSTGCDHGGFFKTRENLRSPDLQVRFLAAQAITADGMGTYTKFKETASVGDGFSFQSIAVRPFSQGQVLLRSKNPRDKPKIETGYLSDFRDVVTIREGLKICRKIASSKAFDSYRGSEVFPGEHIQSDGQLDEYIRRTVHTSNAITGTCKMGTDEYSVVGPDLKVHGVKGVRISDASIMPKIPGGQTSSPTVMIAERASELLLQGIAVENRPKSIAQNILRAISFVRYNAIGKSRWRLTSFFYVLASTILLASFPVQFKPISAQLKNFVRI